MLDLNNDQKIAYELVKDRKSGKMSADNCPMSIPVQRWADRCLSFVSGDRRLVDFDYSMPI